MFEWLEQELSAINTSRFHSVDGSADIEMRKALMQHGLTLPASYKEFVLKFGNARLYRRLESNAYRIGIFAQPQEHVLGDGTHVYQVGFHEGARVYIAAVTGSTGATIWEIQPDSKERVGEDFEEWLAASCALARKEYGAEKWAEILCGPEPFTPEEEEIVEARRRIRWRVLGIDTEGNHVFEVINTSNRGLPVLTVGVRSRDRRLNGAILLDIGSVGPGQTATLHAGCYKDLKLSGEIETFELPDPQPEDRDFYGEFAHMNL